jgi:endonuclease/exonuclease/phosphatase family metal-dependent hydrolase
MSEIRILDLNIWNYNEPWLARRDRIVDLILDTRPDIVALQEIRYHDWTADPRHQADQILSRLSGYASIWHPAHYWPPRTGDNLGEIKWEGLAILSKHPIVDQAVLHLSRDAGDPRDSFQRLVLGAQVRLPGGPFWLFDTHFPLSEQARNRVVVEALAFVMRTAGDLAFAFTGDLNAQPQDPPIRFLTGQADLDGQYGNLVDTWAACHPDEPGYTHWAWDPCRRIDYLFIPSTIRVQGISVVGIVPHREAVSPSDHCGLLATLRVPPGD